MGCTADAAQSSARNPRPAQLNQYAFAVGTSGRAPASRARSTAASPPGNRIERPHRGGRATSRGTLCWRTSCAAGRRLIARRVPDSPPDQDRMGSGTWAPCHLHAGSRAGVSGERAGESRCGWPAPCDWGATTVVAGTQSSKTTTRYARQESTEWSANLSTILAHPQATGRRSWPDTFRPGLLDLRTQPQGGPQDGRVHGRWQGSSARTRGTRRYLETAGRAVGCRNLTTPAAGL